MTEILATGVVPPRAGNRSAAAAPHGCYRCRGDDRWCAISVETEDAWDRFCRAVERPAWRSDPRFVDRAARVANVDALDGLVEAWTAERAAADVMSVLQAHCVAAGVVQNVADLAADPQLAARGFFETLEHLTRATVVATGIPLGLTETPPRSGRSGQAIGQDHAYVFGELLGLAPEEVAAARASGAIEAAD